MGAKMKKIIMFLLVTLISTTFCTSYAFAVNSKQIKSYLDLGEKNYKAQKYKDALNNFNAAIKLDPKCVEAYDGKGRVLVEQGKVHYYNVVLYNTI